MKLSNNNSQTFFLSNSHILMRKLASHTFVHKTKKLALILQTANLPLETTEFFPPSCNFKNRLPNLQNGWKR